ncbi:lysylphosphatidylglycerol synthase transmembrane domain-containing protein [Negativibacillus massiliensis]|uniref:lysylphosphatidylglycerol synthase transmembrane domain-containing protein n=1 Tax=Negativibacillus massiliensis TaxID=1871035 RepID=UPI0023F7C2CB|nr:lysylphosphatidylglycerol synthase transmembrane domain-containing protein [Negativibacillus massiliensis]
MKADTKGYAKGLAFITGTFAVLCIWLLKQYSIQALWKMMLGVRPLWILAALGLMVVYWVFESLGLHLAVSRFVPTQNPGDTFCATMIGQFFNCITPFSSGGQPMQAWYLVKKGVSLSFASCSLLIKFIVYQFVLTIYSALTLLLCFKSFAGRISSIGWLIFVGFGVNLLVITGLLCLGFLRRPTEKVLYGSVSLLKKVKLISEQAASKAKERIQKELMEFYEGFAQIRQDIGGILAMSALTAVQLTAFFLIPLCIFYAFGLGKADVLLMICSGAFVLNFTSFIPLPGAAAGAEIGFHTIFSIFFPTHILSVAILFWRLLTFYLPICVGGCFTATAGVWRKNKKQISA